MSRVVKFPKQQRESDDVPSFESLGEAVQRLDEGIRRIEEKLGEFSKVLGQSAKAAGAGLEFTEKFEEGLSLFVKVFSKLDLRRFLQALSAHTQRRLIL